MFPEKLNEVGLSEEIWKQLIDYYKWIVSISVFILTISVTLVSLLSTKSLNYTWLLLIGWILLGFCIFIVWLLIKRLVFLPLLFSIPHDELQPMHILSIMTIGNIQKYAFVQNLLFLLGILSISVGFILNIIL